MRQSLAGTRIRQIRRTAGLRQSALAQAAGISPSYLNLIEHNRRNAGSRVLGELAAALGVSVSALEEGAETELVADLRDVGGNYADQLPELSSVEEFIGRFPGWARIAALQSHQMQDLAASMATLTDRLNYDPQLQDTLHEMLTRVTAIRSASGILTAEADLQPDEAARFQGAVYNESVLLSDATQELVAYFDRTEDAPAKGATPQEDFELFLAAHNFSFPEIDAAPQDDALRDRMIATAPLLASGEAKERATAWLGRYARDAAALPLQPFLNRAKETGFAPTELAATFSANLHAVFRRLATLPRDTDDLPAFGLVIVNAAGQPIFRRPLPEFSLPRFSSICALWPVFQSFSMPDQPVEEVISLPNGREFLARSVALPVAAVAFGERPSFASAMSVTSLNDAHLYGMMGRVQGRPVMPVGTSCRLCQRNNCPARSDPSLAAIPEAQP